MLVEFDRNASVLSWRARKRRAAVHISLVLLKFRALTRNTSSRLQAGAQWALGAVWSAVLAVGGQLSRKLTCARGLGAKVRPRLSPTLSVN